jgi:hypothetical protein
VGAGGSRVNPLAAYWLGALTNGPPVAELGSLVFRDATLAWWMRAGRSCGCCDCGAVRKFGCEVAAS